MNFFNYNEIFLTCPDPAAVYTYSLFSVHHEIMQYIVFILIFCYWLLYKIIKDFDSGLLQKASYNVFNNFIFSFFYKLEVYFMFCIFYTLRPLFWLFIYCIEFSADAPEFLNSKKSNLKKILNFTFDIDLDFWSTIQLLFIRFYCNIYFNLFYYFFGLSSKLISAPLNIVDFSGKSLFNSDLYLFSSFIIEELIFDFNNLTYNLDDFSYLNIEREIFNFTYYKKTDAFFYNGLININNYTLFSYSKSRKYGGLTSYSNSFYNNTLNYIGLKLFTLSSSNYTALEYAWLVGPTIFIYLILGPSIMVTYAADAHNFVSPSVTYKVTAHQWFWQYEHYVDKLFNSSNLENPVLITASQDIYSNIITYSDLNIGDTRLRMTNNPLIVPMNQTLRFLITSNDVLHAFGVPELGIKLDAVPGRINAVSTLITKPGVYFGACYEICGVYHGFMPINIIALPWNVYDAVLIDNLTTDSNINNHLN